MLPDAFSEVKVVSKDGRVRYAFDDIAGNRVTSEDQRFAGKVVLIDVFGTWCPNCNDAAALLSRLAREHRAKGLEVVGLAYEFTGRPERDREMVRRFADKYSITYPLLLAGVSDKKKASATLPDLSSIRSYPTTIFIGRDGRARKIHAGFAGPGTGEHHTKLVREFESIIETLLAQRLGK